MAKHVKPLSQGNKMGVKDELSEWLASEEKDDNVSKELFSSEDIKTRTEVSNDEIASISKINFICGFMGLERFPAMVNEFLELRVSHKRKSRGEFIKSLKQQDSGAGFNPFQRGGFS